MRAPTRSVLAKAYHRVKQTVDLGYLCTAPNNHQVQDRAILLVILEGLGGRTRARTWDPTIKSGLQVVLIQSLFQHVLVLIGIEIIGEFSMINVRLWRSHGFVQQRQLRQLNPR